MFAFVGASRTGKTTLAKAAAETLGWHYYDGSFGLAAKRLGFEAVRPQTVLERIEMQEAVLGDHVLQLESLPRPCITDRTPLDYIGYTLAEVGMHALEDTQLMHRIHRFVETCLHVTRQHYDTVIACRPLAHYAEEEGKPPVNPAYQWHVQWIIEGAMNQVNDVVQDAYLKTDDHELRLEAAVEVFAKQFEERLAGREFLTLH